MLFGCLVVWLFAASMLARMLPASAAWLTKLRLKLSSRLSTGAHQKNQEDEEAAEEVFKNLPNCAKTV
jgi:hypothetical protein